jgi:hypothetical protein
LDVVVLDHHRVEVSPPCVAHVNPNQPDDTSGLGHLCAAGVTFLFLVALNRHLRDSNFYQERGMAEPDLRLFLDLVGLATVCDVVPLNGINRAFVRFGLGQLGNLSRPGLAALAGIAGAKPPFTPYSFGFLFGPRINAGGRVGRSSLGVDLLTTRDPGKAAEFARPILVEIRARVHAACPRVEETIKWGMPSFTYADGILCGMAAFKRHVSFGYWKHALVMGDAERDGMGSYGKLASPRDLPPKARMQADLKRAMKLNEQGVKSPPRRAAPKPPPEMPGDLAAALEGNGAAKSIFEAFPPGCRREYIEWIGGAKREETRAKRIAQALEWLAEGKRRNWKYEGC